MKNMLDNCELPLEAKRVRVPSGPPRATPEQIQAALDRARATERAAPKLRLVPPQPVGDLLDVGKRLEYTSANDSYRVRLDRQSAKTSAVLVRVRDGQEKAREELRRTSQLHFRVTGSEREEIEFGARRAGVSPCRFMREAALHAARAASSEP